MRFHPAMALDRALTSLPRCELREKLIASLLDDAGEDGMYPVYRDIRSVADIIKLGPDGVLKLPTVHDAEAVQWLFAELANDSQPKAEPVKVPEPERPPEIDYLAIFDRAAGEPGTCVGDRINRLDGLQYNVMTEFIATLAAAVFPDRPMSDAQTALVRSPDFAGMRPKLIAHLEPFKLRGDGMVFWDGVDSDGNFQTGAKSLNFKKNPATKDKRPKRKPGRPKGSGKKPSTLESVLAGN